MHSHVQTDAITSDGKVSLSYFARAVRSAIKGERCRVVPSFSDAVGQNAGPAYKPQGVMFLTRRPENWS